MERRQNGRVIAGGLDGSVRFGDFKLRSEKRLCGGSAEAYDQVGTDGFDFDFEPRAARKYLAG